MLWCLGGLLLFLTVAYIGSISTLFNPCLALAQFWDCFFTGIYSSLLVRSDCTRCNEKSVPALSVCEELSLLWLETPLL